MRDRREAAYGCVVFKMRERGVRLPPAEVMVKHFYEGALVLSDQYTWPAWHAVLLQLPDIKKAILTMHDVTLKRARGGFRQYAGWEWNEKATERYPQTWFCAPNHESGVSVLASMPWLGAVSQDAASADIGTKDRAGQLVYGPPSSR
jgi:hypothetical protein